MAVTSKKPGRKEKLLPEQPSKPARGKGVKSLSLGSEVEKLTKRYTEDVKNIGQKYGKILDVKVLITISDDT
jgi:hypothetical protein